MPDRGVAYENFKKASMQDNLPVNLCARHGSLQGAVLRLWTAATWPCRLRCCYGMQGSPAETVGQCCCSTKGQIQATMLQRDRSSGASQAFNAEAANPCCKTLAVA